MRWNEKMPPDGNFTPHPQNAGIVNKKVNIRN